MFKYIVNIDQQVELYMLSLNSYYLDIFFRFITHLGGFLVVVPIVLLVIYFLLNRDRVSVKYFMTAIFLTEMAVYFLKYGIGRLRPFGALKYSEFGPSLPSGHATIAMFLYGYICYLVIKFYPKGGVRNLLVLCTTTLVFLIGFSRIYLDVHYLSDVLAGYALGGSSLYWLIKYTKKLKKVIPQHSE